MDKQNVVDTSNGVLFNLKKGGNPTVCDKTVEAGGHHAR